jgi:cytochrome c biogenesis protein CcmG, thiol:disulfide interchange protein DsbE
MPSTRPPRARSSAVAQAQRAGEGSRTVWFIVAGVIIVGLAAVLAVALAQEESTSSSSQTAAVTITGEPLPLYPPDNVSQAVGLTAPEVSGTALGGGSMSISNDGTPRVIGFFTHWCPACRTEVPVVSEWYNSGGAPDDVDFVAVSTAVNPAAVNYPPSAWFDDEDWNVPTLLDDSASSASIAFGLSAYPYWVVIDADGQVVDQLTGQLGVDEINQLMERAREGVS